ncbi:glycine betaine ABC transporter substrate-binding protein [Spelaeicoccus albus]|uniref:ABC transporter substrate-binding protein n=1 Tax=Spelaeicoccus albus TaxID=1280376 RepID=UPI001C543420|nr:glycine betaine ABC transporter substrate-binding protein [Spelaeicoccus albus]
MLSRRQLVRAAAIGVAGAVPLAVSGCAGATSTSKRGGMITIGTKEFTEEWVLGELYAQALEARGYQVQVKNNIGSTEIIDRALKAGRIDVYPEYTGVVLQVLAKRSKLPKTAHETYRQAKAFEERRGMTMLQPTPFQNKDAVAVTKDYAEKHHLKTVADLRKLGTIYFGEYPDNIESSTGYSGLVKTYHLPNVKVKSLNIGLQYKALEKGAIQAADVFTTDPQLARSNLVLLTEPKNLFGFQNVAPVVRKDVYHRHPAEVWHTLNAIDALLTVKAARAMNRAVAVNRLSPSQVAKKFLQVNQLL